HVLAVRDGCAPDQCSAFAWLRDTSRINVNLAERPFEARVKTYAASWPAVGGRGVASTPPSPAPSAAAKVPNNLYFPSATSSPPAQHQPGGPPAGAPAAPRHARRGRTRAADAATPAAAGGFAAASALERRTRALGAHTGCSRAISASIF